MTSFRAQAPRTAAGTSFSATGGVSSTDVQAAIAELDSEKSPKASPTFTGNATFTGSVNYTLTDDTAFGVQFTGTHDSASPAVGDRTFAVVSTGKDDGGNSQTYGLLGFYILDPVGGSEDGEFRVYTAGAGTNSQRLSVQLGLIVGSPTGGDKGAGTINATAVYDDNTLLTCPALQAEYLEKGTIDLEKWDALVPDLVVPAEKQRRPVVEEVTLAVNEKSADGTMYVRRIKTISRQVVDLIPVYDDKGNGLDAVEEPLFEEVIVPAQTIKRTHTTARLFQAMVDEGFDPRDPLNYITRLKTDQALPGMPTQTDWQQGKYSLGELASRKWLAMEFLALAFIGLEERVAALEA